MSATEFQLNQIAQAFFERNRTAVALEELLKELDFEVWDTPKDTLKTALALRGLTLANGMVSETGEAAPLEPVKTDYLPFLRAAKNAMEIADKPISAAELMSMVGLATEAIPAASMAYHLRKIGIYFIPGVGYWRRPQYASPRGEVWTARFQSPKLRRVMELFKEYGWPLAGQDVEEWSGGIVTSRFMSMQAHRMRQPVIATIGNGLFVPAAVVADHQGKLPPMTHNVVAALLDHDPRLPVFRCDDVRLYKLANMLAALDLATVREQWALWHGRRARAIKMELTEDCRNTLAGLDKRAPKDEF